MNDLVKLFISTTEASLAALKRGIEQGDAAACRKEAHALKGAAASVMAMPFRKAPPGLKPVMRHGDFACAAAELDALETTFPRTRLKSERRLTHTLWRVG